MSAPGFTCAGFSIHLATFSGVFFMMPAAIVVRLPKCVRFGPSTPADRPSMVWQPMQADWLKPHTDALLDVDDCLAIDQVAGQFVHLVEGAHEPLMVRSDYILI